ncbi:MAG: NAD+ synthase, partial [Anaerolineae bacterium]|nr:NAD+ synthase [Anaerolineae bacterium]
MTTMRLALAQINVTVGDLDRNVDKIIAFIERGKMVQADLILFPELVVTGYPPEDLLLKPSFLTASRASVERVAEACIGVTAVVGYVDVDGDVYNSAAVIHDGRIRGTYHKQYLPNYSVFDE